MSEFKGKAGTIYVEKDDSNEKPYEVWFEDFCILGVGDSQQEALRDAVGHVRDIGTLVSEALKQAQAAVGSGD